MKHFKRKLVDNNQLEIRVEEINSVDLVGEVNKADDFFEFQFSFLSPDLYSDHSDMSEEESCRAFKKVKYFHFMNVVR